jgi:hypothetical protein
MRKPWTEDEDKILLDLYPNNFSQIIADKLDRSVFSIYTRANILGVKKTDEFMKIALEREANKLREVGQKTRYAKGSVPLNKGIKMTEEQYKLVKPTMFAKGNNPHNMKYDGHIRICKKDGYHYVRIARAKYVLKHRHIYEQHHGSIPEGMIVIFVDGNKTNFDICNLRAITRVEHVNRNRVHNYPQEIKDLIKLKNKLNKKINEKQN